MKVAVIGAGRMGSALIGGFIKSGVVSPEDIIVSDRDEEKVRMLEVKTTTSNALAVKSSDVVFLAVKPQQMEEVLKEVKEDAKSKLVVSIAAGITTSFIEGILNDVRVVRVMPNTPALVQEMAAAYCLGKNPKEEDVQTVEKLFGSMGLIFKVDEELMDAVTGLSGSGPAFVYHFIDARAKEHAKEKDALKREAKEFKETANNILETGKIPQDSIGTEKQSEAAINLIKGMKDAGVDGGIDEAIALKLTTQTTEGAAEMILKTEKEPQELIDMVRSPGGTTNAGMEAIESSGIDISEQSTPANIYELSNLAVKAAIKRSKELSKL